MKAKPLLHLGALALLANWVTSAPEPIGDFALEAGLETSISDDIRLVDALTTFQGVEGHWQYSGTISAGQIALDYVPAEVDRFSIFHREGRLIENRFSGEISLTNTRREHLEWTLTTGAYDGFTRYRSLWISNWYQLQFDGLDGVIEPDPYGYYATGALRWDYNPGAGVLQTQITLARDNIPPAFDDALDEFENLIGAEVLRTDLNTAAWLISTENVVTGWLRTLLEYRLTNQSERELRHSITGRANIALSDSLFSQFRIGATYEKGGEEADEDFRAFWVGQTFLWEFNENLTFDVGARYYVDNGEIENATGFSSAGPDLDSFSAQIGLRYHKGPHALRIALGWINSEYGSLDFENQFFGGLYQNRDFVTTSIAYRVNF